MTYNDSNINYGSDREAVFHLTIIGFVCALVAALYFFGVPLKTMPTTTLEHAEFTELAELRAAETAALTTTEDKGDGTHVIPIAAAKAALVADPGLLSTAFAGMGDAAAAGDDDDADPLVAQGKTLFASKTCFTCHSTDGSRMVGPTFKGLLGRETTLADGSTVTADEAYIVESIKDPNAKVGEGYPPAMVLTQTVNDEEIAALIAWIGTLE